MAPTARARLRPAMTSLELPPELKAGLEAVKVRDGIPHSEQIRRAIRAWLTDKGIDLGALARTQARAGKATSRRQQ